MCGRRSFGICFFHKVKLLLFFYNKVNILYLYIVSCFLENVLWCVVKFLELRTWLCQNSERQLQKLTFFPHNIQISCCLDNETPTFSICFPRDVMWCDVIWDTDLPPQESAGIWGVMEIKVVLKPLNQMVEMREYRNVFTTHLLTTDPELGNKVHIQYMVEATDIIWREVTHTER